MIHGQKPACLATTSNNGGSEPPWLGFGIMIHTRGIGQRGAGATSSVGDKASFTISFQKKKTTNMGIAIINHPLLMIYTTHLW